MIILPKSIFLIRHGESKGNVDKTLYASTPDWKIPLTKKGREQAKKAGQLLSRKLHGSTFHQFPFQTDTYMYASPWYRASETAKIIHEELKREGYGVKCYEDPRLREQEWGNFQAYDKKTMQKDRYKYGTFFYRIPGGESGADVYDRVTTFLDTMYRDMPRNAQDMIVVSHGLAIKAFLMRWFHWSVDEFESIQTPGNCQIIEMTNKHGRLELKSKLRRKKPKLKLQEKLSSIVKVKATSRRNNLMAVAERFDNSEA